MTEHNWIGRYRIDAPLGEGAMANVSLAYDPSIGRTVAIKVLKPEYRGAGLGKANEVPPGCCPTVTSSPSMM